MAAGDSYLLFGVSVALGSLLSPLSAQVVTVRVTDAEGRQPVLGALVSLERDGKTRVAQSLSNAQGRVVLQGAGAATYRVRADRIGYEGLFSANAVPRSRPCGARRRRP
jgi:hypothetical protein